MALPPGPETPMPTAVMRWIRNAPEVMEDCLRRYGDTFTLRLPASGLRTAHVVVTCHPETIKEVFTGPSELLHAGAAAVVLAPLVGESSLLLLDGAQHLRQRRLMLPAFHGDRMKTYVAAMRDETLMQVRNMPMGQPLALHPHLQQLTLRVILRTVFGLQDADEMKPLADCLTRVLDVGADPMLLLHNLLPVAVGSRRVFQRELARADRLIYDVIARRRRDEGLDRRTDVLAMLLTARDESGQPMTDAELRDELMTLLVAGHETTATSLAWAVRLLLDHRADLDRACAEARDHLGGDITAEDVGNVPFIDAVVKESLRLRPVIPLVGRVLQVPMTFRGFRLPAGSAIAPSTWLTHRNPSIYPEPERFLPERFVGTKPNPYAWLPFGGGIRRCLGQAFALVEMKVVMATLLRHLDLEAASPEPVSIVRRSITFAPSDGTRIVARRRSSRRAA